MEATSRARQGVSVGSGLGVSPRKQGQLSLFDYGELSAPAVKQCEAAVEGVSSVRNSE